MKITIAGTGYVGLSLATLLAKEHKVVALDIVSEKITQINNRISPIEDKHIKKAFKEELLDLTATLDHKTAFKGADFIIISTPTNYDDKTNQFDTSSIENVLEKAIPTNPQATIVIKSTVPVGYTEAIRKKYHTRNIFFSPEFLREGKSLYDNLYPSRIIIGDTTPKAHNFGRLLQSCAKNNPPVLYMLSTEAEAVKLFANTYLALRIAYFNELDTYAEIKNLDTKKIIKGVSLDARIGDFYNNPSFGYGGYCLPKDTKQLLSNYDNIPQNLIGAIVKANQTRKQHIADVVITKQPQTVGVYRLTMKTDSDNFRSSAIQDIIEKLKNHRVPIIIFEPTLKASIFNGCPIIKDLEEFASKSSIILANRVDHNILKYKEKIYTRDLFNKD